MGISLPNCDNGIQRVIKTINQNISMIKYKMKALLTTLILVISVVTPVWAGVTDISTFQEILIVVAIFFIGLFTVGF